MRTRIVQITLVCAAVAGCGSIRDFEKIAQPMGRPLSAGLGDVVLRIDRSKSLPNAFGAADVFGRKTYAGFSQIRYLGIEPSGTIILSRRDVEIQSNETTMSASRNPIAIANTQATAQTGVVSSGNYATATTSVSAQSMTVQPTSDYHIAIPADEIAIRLPPGVKRVPIAGHSLELLEATPVGVTYTIN